MDSLDVIKKHFTDANRWTIFDVNIGSDVEGFEELVSKVQGYHLGGYSLQDTSGIYSGSYIAIRAVQAVDFKSRVSEAAKELDLLLDPENDVSRFNNNELIENLEDPDNGFRVNEDLKEPWPRVV